MAKFVSEIKHLVLQDEEGVWAYFQDHVFETGDKKVAARLQGVDGVSEVKDEKPADKPADAGDNSK